MKFSERCRREATANVIFLLQSRRWVVTSIPDYHDADDPTAEYGVDDEGDIILGRLDGNHWTPLEDAEPLKMTEVAEMMNDDDIPCAIETWETERVFLTREEANTYARARDYNYPSGWRVYALPAEGELVKLLRKT